MKIIPVIDAKAHLSSYLEQCHRESIVITRNGRARALLIPAPEDQDELERLMLAYSPKLWRLMEQAAARIQKTGGIPHDKFWAMAEQRRASQKGPKRKRTR